MDVGLGVDLNTVLLVAVIAGQLGLWWQTRAGKPVNEVPPVEPSSQVPTPPPAPARRRQRIVKHLDCACHEHLNGSHAEGT